MAKIIKVMFVATEFAPGMIPFAARIINTLSKDSRFEVLCLCVNSNEKTYVGKINENVRVFFLENSKNKVKKLLNKFFPLNIVKKIREIERNESPDFIHFLTGDFSLGLYALTILKHNQYCYTVHDLIPHEVKYASFFDALLKKWINLGYKILRESSGNLTTSSLEQCDLLKKMYPKKNVKYTQFPSLVNSIIEQGTTKIPELQNIKRYILFFGSVCEYKGVNLLIDAFDQLNDPSIFLVIAGKGENYGCENDKIIRLNRFFDDSELADLFKKAQFVVYPYLKATMSGVLSIALYFNKDVLLSDVPFFKENSCINSTFFRTNDVVDLKDKLSIMLHSKRVENNRCYFDLYSDEKIADAYYNFYLRK